MLKLRSIGVGLTMDKIYAIDDQLCERCQCFNCMYDLSEQCGNCVTCYRHSKCCTICKECENRVEKKRKEE